jgi:plasmid stabilization system protein ParE
MNPKYEVIWTNVAENDLKDIIEYISIVMCK